MTEPSRAVFLSYASQDAQAAQRICEALRAGGIEVWFDQSELRGGDAWDQKIRREIRTCALFIPVISQRTQARTEGYFRLEWHLADQRTHLMARSRAFLLPVCIDDTQESAALVPEQFKALHIVRMHGGDPPADFRHRAGAMGESVSAAAPGGSHIHPRACDRGVGRRALDRGSTTRRSGCAACRRWPGPAR